MRPANARSTALRSTACRPRLPLFKALPPTTTCNAPARFHTRFLEPWLETNAIDAASTSRQAAKGGSAT
jgi:hypothetical protein